MRRNENGFTLIELLVVIAIIAMLVGATTVMVRIADKSKKRTVNTQRMNSIKAALEILKSADNLGYSPSADTALLRGPDRKNLGEKLGVPNDTNVGIETLWIAFHLNGVSVSIDDVSGEGALGNTDEDEISDTSGTTLANTKRLEFLDSYGNPFVYFGARDYKDSKKLQRYVNYLGETVEAKPWTSETTGEPEQKDSFQIFSMGPDGKPNTEDDEKGW